jgi:hypothetical protein
VLQFENSHPVAVACELRCWKQHEQAYDSNAALHGRFRTGMDGGIDRNLNPRHRSVDGHTHSASQRDRAQVELYQTLC